MIVFRRLLNHSTLKQTRKLSHALVENLKPISNEGLVWRANENDPRKHTSVHEGLYYILPEDKQLIQIYGSSYADKPSIFDIDTTIFYQTLAMYPIMVRKPFLDAMQYMKNVTTGMSNVRIVFYGDLGHGKTHTLAHLVHLIHLEQEYFIVNIRQSRKLTRSPLSIDPSTSRPGRIDNNVNAALLLQQFKIQNALMLEKYNDKLKCSKDYSWSIRESCKVGDPLVNVIDHGISRVIHASDCLAVLLKELTSAADAGSIKLATLIDDVQFLYNREAGVIKHADKKLILVDEMTVARSLKKIIKGNQRNSIVFAACDDKLSPKPDITPQIVLGQEGWHHFDPFIPIKVPKYSRKEYESCMNFYQDTNWLTRPESRTREVRDEIRFISGLNPGQVQYLCQAI